MKIDTIIVIFLLAVLSSNKSDAQDIFPYKLTKTFEVKGFESPESVVKDTRNNVLYVSNIVGDLTAKDGTGYISKVSMDGKIIDKKWIDGLNAPKGLAIYKNKLYIADIDNIVRVNIKTGKKKIFKVKGATFLNDVTVSKTGDVYVSNTFGLEGIYKLSKNKVSLWLKDEKINTPNGLLVQGNNLYAVTWGTNTDPKTFITEVPGKFIRIDLKTKTITDVVNSLGNLDGLVATIHGYMISDWLAGKLLYYSEGKTYEALDLPQGSADISFDKKNKLILVPQMIDGKLVAYKLSK